MCVFPLISFFFNLFVSIYLDLTVHGAGEQKMPRAWKQTDTTDTLENKLNDVN